MPAAMRSASSSWPRSRSAGVSSQATFIQEGPRHVRHRSKPGLNDGSSIATEGIPNAAR
jgi:hypothetical protein